MKHALPNRVALVTGASRGLGASIARSLAESGAAVALNYFSSPEKAEALAAELEKSGARAAAFKADVRDEQQVKQMVAAVESKFGPIDVLVINATGPQPMLKLEELTWRACLDQLEFFVKSPVLLMQATLAQMKKRRYGRIIQIGSEVFDLGIPQFSNYVSAKGAQLGLSRSWARELAPFQITVNTISPGWIPTERHVNDPQSAKDAYAADVPMQRMGVPTDIGAAVAFLASDAANFITGQNIAINGGKTLG
ncbi:MAG TPA: SDR family oxidoreductase [Tepidisphaeraceae bacterium]|jgi:3-oxoacyl-[acyl-carrier protein] reductase